MRAAILFVGLIFATQTHAACNLERIDLRGNWGQASFNIEVADDGPERSQGLMHRESMAPSAGMLFVYDFPQTVAFWMRNTLIPLDLIFADEFGVVQRVHADAIPLDETSIPGGNGIQFVLEINAGLAARYGISKGSELRHPAIPQNSAVWPCG